MKHPVLGAVCLITCVAAVGDAKGHLPAAQFETQCLHGSRESEIDRSRREAAFRIAHAFNAAQAAAIAGSPNAIYRRVGQLNLPTIPDNFQLTLHLNGRVTYQFSLKDSADPCYFAIYSDQDGYVYGGHPDGSRR